MRQKFEFYGKRGGIDTIHTLSQLNRNITEVKVITHSLSLSLSPNLTFSFQSPKK